MVVGMESGSATCAAGAVGGGDGNNGVEEFMGVSDDEIVALVRRESARVVMTVVSTRGSGSGRDCGRGRIWNGHSAVQQGTAEWQSSGGRRQW
jgi:hypothetical protein